MNCPNCGSDQTRKFQVIYEQGTSSGSAGTVLFGSETEFAVTQSSSQTLLAQKVAPPDQHDWTLFGVICSISFLVALATGIVSIVIGFIFLIISGISFLLCIGPYQFNKNKWPELYEKWTRGWYCFKCGQAFLQKKAQ